MTISRSYFWSAALIVVPVVLLAGLAAWGLGAQRKATRSDAQQQAQRIAVQAAEKYREAYISMARENAAETQGLTLPVPPATVSPLVAELETAIAAEDRSALEKLATVSLPIQLTGSGLPVHILAAIAVLDLGPPIASEVSDISHLLYPPNLLSQHWLETLETTAIALPRPAPGTFTMEDATYLTLHNAASARNRWEHDQWVRQAFWDETTETWRHTTPGPYFLNGELCCLARYTPPQQPSIELFPADSTKESLPRSGRKISHMLNTISVLTQDDLTRILRRDYTLLLPPWLGLSVTMNGRPLLSAPIHPIMHCNMTGNPDAKNNIIWDRIDYRKVIHPDPQDEWLDPSPNGEILAIADGPFTVTATLRQPDILFEPTDRFARWTALLLGGSVLCAVLGIWVLKRNLDRERRLSDLKSQFVSSVSHELRAPVGSLRLMADALDAGTVTGEQAQQFHRLMSQEGARLSSLIENVLDFARIEESRKTYTLEETDISKLVEDTVQVMAAAAKAHQISIQTDLQPLTHIPKVDAPALQQALVNLLDNAIKFSPAGETITVTLAEKLPTQTWSLAVTDHGPGIPKAEHLRIFERFHRLGNELRRETQGTGIGLSLVKHIVEGNGGTVLVHSGQVGSIFEMQFPSKA